MVYDDAPYRWYDTYNLKFRVRFNNFCDTAASARDNAGEYMLGDILNALEDAVLDFPPFPNFPELRPDIHEVRETSQLVSAKQTAAWNTRTCF